MQSRAEPHRAASPLPPTVSAFRVRDGAKALDSLGYITHLHGHLRQPSKLEEGRKYPTNLSGKSYWVCCEGTILNIGSLSQRHIALSILSYMWFMMPRTLAFASTSSPGTILITKLIKVEITEK